MPTTCALPKAGLWAQGKRRVHCPLCRGHHRELRRCGDKETWWERAGVNPTAAARPLWLTTHPISTARINSAIEDTISMAPGDQAPVKFRTRQAQPV